MDWRTATIAVGIFAQVICVSSQVVANNTDCRQCSETCLSVPKADGSCPVCICNGVALPDCPSLPDVCPRNCMVQLDTDGCNQCVCRRETPFVCPPLPPCPEECQQLMDEDGCPRCLCDAPPRNCPAITCPDLCTEEVGDDGCRSCRCQRTEICPPIEPCLRGCIENDADSGCFICNCKLLPEVPVRSPEINPFDFGLLGPIPFDDDSFEIRSPIPSPVSARCRNERLFCPPDCRKVVAWHGCRECICGEDAYLCPGVPRCSRRCLFLSPEDKCCRCDCSGPRPGVFRVTVIKVPSFKPFKPFGPLGPFGPFGPFGPMRPEVGIRPEVDFGVDVDFDSIPFLPPFSPGEPENNCTVDPATCNSECSVVTDADGCPLCECPGDLCPRIRCPERCVRQIDLNGCPICNCGGGVEPTNPDAEPSDPLFPRDPIRPEEPGEPVNPNTPMLPGEPISPVTPIETMNPEVSGEPTDPDTPLLPADSPGPVAPNEPMSPEVPSEPIDPDNPLLPVEPAVPIMPVEPASPDTPAEPTGPIMPVNPNSPETLPQPEVPANPVLTDEEVFPFNPIVPEVPANTNIGVPLPTAPLTPANPSRPFEPVDPAQPPDSAAPATPAGSANPSEIPADADSVFESTLRTGGPAQPTNKDGSSDPEKAIPADAEAEMNPAETPAETRPETPAETPAAEATEFTNPDAENIIPVVITP